MSTIYRKTDKGRAEIATRAHRLPPSLRTALIMVDGVRDDADLARLIQASDEVLQALHEQGFIEPLALRTVAPPAPPLLSAASELAARRGNFASRQRDAVRMLNDALGPVGEDLAMRIEKAKDEMTLRPLLVLARDSIRSVRGAAAGDAFAAKFLG